LVAQTTLGLYEWEGVLEDAQRRYPELATARRSDLCYATTNRQTAIKQLADRADTILVVGSQTSSNTQALVRVGRKQGTPTHRVDGPDDIDQKWLDSSRVVGVTAGASAPDQRVREVIDAIAPVHGVALLSITDEDEYFPLPPSLRKLVKTPLSTLELPDGVKSWAVVAWFMAVHRDKFIEFLTKVREEGSEVDQEAELQRIFGKGLEALDEDWRKYALRAF